MNAARSLHDRLWERFQREQAGENVRNVTCAHETESHLSPSLSPIPSLPQTASRARVTIGTVELLADGMCPHIEPAARSHPANIGRTVRCSACWLTAHPDWRPRRRRFFGSIEELRQHAEALRDRAEGGEE